MESNKLLEKINDSIEEAIKPILKKGESMTPADLESLTKAVCIVEKIKRIEDCNSFDDSDYYDNGYSYTDNGNSYRRGRSPVTGRFVSRDSMPHHDGASYGYHYDAGHYSNRHNDNGNAARAFDNGASTRRYYDGGSMHNGYSGHSIQDRMIDQLERMYDEAQSEHERQIVQSWINRLKN